MYKTHYKNTENDIYAAMISCLDEGIGNLTRTLKQQGLYDNTLIIFSSDNGAPSNQAYPHGSGTHANWPLRGGKLQLYEGGIRVPAFIHSNLLNKDVLGSSSWALLHITDWFSTLLYLSGSNSTDQDLDGYNQWHTINASQMNPRTEILHNIDVLQDKVGSRVYPERFDTRIRAAIRVGDWKLLTGNPCTDHFRQLEGTKPNQNILLFNIKNDPGEEV